MPAYYPNPYAINYPISYGGGNWYWNPANPQTAPAAQQAPQPTYMINVDGENAAKAWQPTTIPQPNTIIPLFDSDGQHVYFKTYDGYGRMNPIRKGRIVFDDEVQINETPSEQVQTPDMTVYATKDDLDKMKEELEEKLRYHIEQLGSTQKQTNQNGSNSRGGEKK